MRRERDRGSLTAEAVVLAPVLVLIVLVTVYIHRLTDASWRLHRVADVAARTASQSQLDTMFSRGTLAARRELLASYPSCAGARIRMTSRSEGDLLHVSASVSCSVDLGGLSLVGIGQRTVTATSTEVVDYYTNRQG